MSQICKDIPNAVEDGQKARLGLAGGGVWVLGKCF